ncbi:MAG: transposase [Bacteroidales bacterium]|jgi:hypothetical protein|nr:transposase [Bacteroidales bacterium]
MPQDNFQQLAKFLLPEGLLDFFNLEEVHKTDEGFHIHLVEKNIIPKEYSNQKLLSKGFLPEIKIQDFPLRGKAVFLHIKRRRWLLETTGDTVSRDWKLISSGTRITQEFADFLKGLLRHSSY